MRMVLFSSTHVHNRRGIRDTLANVDRFNKKRGRIACSPKIHLPGPMRARTHTNRNPSSLRE